MKKIIVLSGSNSKNSINQKLAIYASTLVENIESKVLDLNDFEMPIYSVDKEKENGIHPLAVAFMDEIRNSDGIILSLAEYNGTYSSAFKNIFEWISRVEQKTFLGKPMLLMSTSPGGRGGITVLEAAQERLPFHEAKISGVFSLPFFQQNFSDGKITNEDFNAKLLEEVKKFSDAI